MFSLGVPELILLLALLLAYPIPTIIAFVRSHPQRFAILLLNLFAGWTVFGWIATLVWAATDASGGSRGTWQSSGEQQFCTQCGAPMRINDNFCPKCGARRGG
jgi:rubrerythrin